MTAILGSCGPALFKSGSEQPVTSTNEQNLDLQLDALRREGVKDPDIYTDKITGTKADRPGSRTHSRVCAPAIRWSSGGWTGLPDPSHTSLSLSTASQARGSPSKA
jgi:hypothetical protein